MNENFKILIAYDGSVFADAALDDLKNAGLSDDVEALVMSVADVWLPPREEGEELQFMTDSLKRKYEENLKVLGQAAEKVKHAEEKLREMFPVWNVSSEATYGSPTWEILSRADKFKPDLIVTGSQGRSALGRVFLGSVSQKIVTEANCSVRVVRGKIETEQSQTRILIGYDGTEGAKEAVESAANRAWREGSEVKVVIVEDSATVVSSLETESEKVIDEFNKKGLTASLLVREGNPKYVIVEEAASWGANNIFVGATRLVGNLDRFLLGSVSSAIVTRAGCTVEVVRPNLYKN